MKRLSQLLRTKFLRDTLTLQASSLLNSVSNIATTVLLAQLLGARIQGQYYVALSLYALLFFVLNQGLYGATVSQVAAASARGLNEKVAAWLGYLLKAYVLVGLALIALGLFVLPTLATRVFHADAETARWAFWLTLTPFCELPKVVVSAALQGTRRMVPFARIENGAELLRFFSVCLGALITGNAFGPVLGTVAASLLASVIAIGVYARVRAQGAQLPGWLEVLGHARDVPLRTGLPLGFKLGLVRSIDAVGTQALPTLILNRVTGDTSAVTYLRIAQRLMTVPLLLMQGLSRNLLPMFSELAGLKEMQRFRQLFVRTSLASGALVSLGVAAALLLVPWAVAHFFPADYHQPVARMALILLPGLVVMSFSIANDTFYLVTDTLRVGMLICMLALLLNALVLWYLTWIPPYGVAWGLSFIYATAALHYVYQFYWFRKHQRERELPPRA